MVNHIPSDQHNGKREGNAEIIPDYTIEKIVIGKDLGAVPILKHGYDSRKDNCHNTDPQDIVSF